MSDPRQQPNEVGVGVGEEGGDAEASGLEFGVGVVAGGADDDGDVGREIVAADLPEDVEAEADGIADVEDDEGGSDGAEVVEGLLAGGDGLGAVADAGEEAAERLASFTVVVDDEDHGVFSPVSPRHLLLRYSVPKRAGRRERILFPQSMFVCDGGGAP